MINIGDCFTIKSFGLEHLHIVVQDERPGQVIGRAICVYLSSIDGKRIIDERTTLKKGDHVWVTEDSFVKYRNVLVDDKTAFESKICKRYPQIDPKILEHIQDQFSSEHPYKNIKRGIIEQFNEWKMDHIFSHPDF